LSQIQIKTVVITCIITLVILLGGYYFYNNYYVKNGLQEQINQVVEIEEIEIAEEENPPTVYIRSSEIKDLQDVYLRIDKIIYQKLGSKYRTVLLDDRTDKLSESLDKCSFVIQESIATGKFQEMHDQVQELAEQEGVQCHLTMDSSSIYLELKDDQGYLYEVIPHQNQSEEREKAGSENN
jgi:hypothetical protein